jgi:hypothetical protein
MVSISAGLAAFTRAPHFKQKALPGGMSAVQVGQRGIADLVKHTAFRQLSGAEGG